MNLKKNQESMSVMNILKNIVIKMYIKYRIFIWLKKKEENLNYTILVKKYSYFQIILQK